METLLTGERQPLSNAETLYWYGYFKEKARVEQEESKKSNKGKGKGRENIDTTVDQQRMMGRK